ncbi:DNA primase subunit pri2 [Savitreella phatthalungensis]
MFVARNSRPRLAARRHFGPEVHRDTDYPHRLSFYSRPPLSEITIEEFQTWALDRLIVLGELEAALYRNKSQSELTTLVRALANKYLPLNPETSLGNKSLQLDAERRKDHYSHFILRLAFCRSEELRSRFIRAETTLFKIRFQAEEATERQRFLYAQQLDWQVVSEEEFAELRHHLMSRAHDQGSQSTTEHDTFFKVPWVRVPDLISQRKVYLKNGMAYVPAAEQLSLVSAEYAKRLAAALEQTARAMPRLDEDDRLLPILEHLSNGFVAPEYNVAAGPDNDHRITAAQVPGMVKHFPLCMRHLQDGLAHSRHLKHFGRLQYGAFLKGIGLDVDQALIFWRTSFSNVTDDKFNKEYRYNIRHTYGLEGNRRNYKPMSCQQILTGPNPSAGDCHGCPYKSFGVDALTAAIERLGVRDTKVIREIQDAVQHRHYHLACTRVFEATHPSSDPSSATQQESISHPNLYFERSLATKRSDIDGKSRT